MMTLSYRVRAPICQGNALRDCTISGVHLRWVNVFKTVTEYQSFTGMSSHKSSQKEYSILILSTLPIEFLFMINFFWHSNCLNQKVFCVELEILVCHAFSLHVKIQAFQKQISLFFISKSVKVSEFFLQHFNFFGENKPMIIVQDSFKIQRSQNYHFKMDPLLLNESFHFNTFTKTVKNLNFLFPLQSFG